MINLLIGVATTDRISPEIRQWGLVLRRAGKYLRKAALNLALAGVLCVGNSAAQEVAFAVPQAREDLTDRLRAASLVLQTIAEGPASPGDITAAARAEYGRLLGALYESGYYSAVISVKLDGREAATIPVLETPRGISRIAVSVQTGPQFIFSRAELAPLAPGTELPPGFAVGRPAPSTAVTEAVSTGISSWRALGYAKAAATGQEIVADHARATLDAHVRLSSGPRLRFGPLEITGNERVRTARIRKIAGLPEGNTFSPEALRLSAERLRRTGAFRSVSLREVKDIGPGDLIGIEALVEEEIPRRIGFGGELSSSEGLRLEGFWLHRNLLGGAERLRLAGEVSGIGGETAGEDYTLSATYSRPATLTPDTALTLGIELEKFDEPDFTLKGFGFEAGLSHIFSDSLTGSLGLGYSATRITDTTGTYDFRTFNMPTRLTWDRRNDKLNATHGFFISAEAMPFLGFGATGSGARVTSDLRGYRALDSEGRAILAARLQFGSIVGPDITETPRDHLFYSGGGGTVRGQDYQSLGVNALPGGQRSGGQQFAGLQAEIRTKLSKRFGLVAFYDLGYIAAEKWGDSYAASHSGAGLGLRYDTGIGPLRVDIATPVTGGGNGVQLYIGIGQSF